MKLQMITNFTVTILCILIITHQLQENISETPLISIIAFIVATILAVVFVRNVKNHNRTSK